MDQIAIVGYSAQTAGAENAEILWEMVVKNKTGIEKIEFDSECKPYSGFIEKTTYFDHEFFGYSFREASSIDPQQRFFLKHVWLALEMAGEAKIPNKNKIGVFATCGVNTYLLNNILSQTSFENLEKDPFALVGNANDFLSSRVGYKLNCQGPCVTIQTGCSGSLVAFHLGKQSLLCQESDLVIIGGVHIPTYEKSGYHYTEGGVLSETGKCRAFDAKADGTIFTPGIGVVILKRLSDAMHDKNTIYGVIKASGINNDGSNKGGFTAPSMEGQSNLIARVLEDANIPVETISYLETHGTATILGDPIEFFALEKAFSEKTSSKHFCKIGALKNNIGHADSSAGILGLIKVLMSFKNNIRPGLLDFEAVNPKMHELNTAFILEASHDAWPKGYHKRAGVSAFGIGGTNAHIILEEYLDDCSYKPEDSVLLFSSKTNDGLIKNIEVTKNALSNHKILPQSVSYTLSVGRANFNNRAIAKLNKNGELDSSSIKKHVVENTSGIIFMFPGQGSQYAYMAAGLYNNIPSFKINFDFVTSLFAKQGIRDLKEIIFSSSDQLGQTFYTQAALFCVEYAMAKYLFSLNIKPKALLGHSLGEYVCYVFAEIISVQEAVVLLSERSRLLGSLQNGAMLSLNTGLDRVLALKPNTVDIAALNAPELITVSGLKQDIKDFISIADKDNIFCRELQTSAAFHSRYVDEIAQEFRTVCERISFRQGNIPVISNLDGILMYNVSPKYLSDHLRNPVDFISMMNQVKKMYSTDILIEVGPGRVLGTLARMNNIPRDNFMQSMKHPSETIDDEFVINNMLGELWLRGININFKPVFEGKTVRKIPLPGYSFQEKDCYIAPSKNSADINLSKRSVENWFYKKGLIEETEKIEKNQCTSCKFINQDDVLDFVDQSVDHLVINLDETTNIESFVKCVRFVQSYSSKLPKLKLLDFVISKHKTPFTTSFIAFAKCIPQELSYLKVRFIDATVGHNDILSTILKSNLMEPYIKIIDRQIFKNVYVKIELPKIKKNYQNILIIGGFGRMSSYYARGLNSLVNGKIILASSSLDFKIDGREKLASLLNNASHNNQKFNELKKLEMLNDKLATVKIDITNIESMHQALQWINKNIGKIDLIIHAAGVSQIEHVRRTDAIDVDYIKHLFEPKIKGLENIKVIQDFYDISDVWAVSSISSILGGIDLLIYTASHLYVDVFCQSQNWVVHNWDALNIESDSKDELGSSLNEIAIRSHEAFKLPEFLWCFDGQTIISTVDLNKRTQDWLLRDQDKIEFISYVNRPNLRSFYVPATTYAEKSLHDIWKNLLGINDIGVEDNFFELGGDSLQAVRLVRHIATNLQWPIKTVDLFENPTLSKLARKFTTSTDVLDQEKFDSRAKKQRLFLDSIRKRKLNNE
ncbi:MAG: SDR family NAD(P)-dependent oxidoreductase [Candidatus Babeliales bacterium]